MTDITAASTLERFVNGLAARAEKIFLEVWQREFSLSGPSEQIEAVTERAIASFERGRPPRLGTRAC